MSDFLNFLNTANLDTLTKTPGITRLIAGNLIAARHFESVDDCLKVRGMGKGLLARMQSAFEAGENPSESRAMITVEAEAAPASIEVSRSVQESAREAKPSFWSRLGRAFLTFLRALLRLFIILVVIVGIGAAIYFAIPFIKETFIVPVERNTTRVGELEVEVATLQTQLQEMDTRVGAMEKTIEAHTASITKLEEMQATLEQETSAQNNSVMIALKREIMLTRAIETLSRARLYLSQSNFGFAKQDVQSTRDILAQLLTDAPAYQVGALNQIVMRLDLALGSLPVFPVIAVDDVDIAWQLMMIGLPESEADAIAIFTPTLDATPTSTSTPTPEPVLEATPTATP
ncbi:MAG: helix-hairpin-helix domain-containing protein [Anaerolineales bacterium]|nr:helix-hairpin-helix domain-containing protein [Anaerolineales bacterium]